VTKYLLDRVNGILNIDNANNLSVMLVTSLYQMFQNFVLRKDVPRPVQYREVVYVILQEYLENVEALAGFCHTP
jgi:hypothetical protein